MAAPEFTLIIGDKNWSSWSLRPWLLMRQAGVPFEEIHVRLRRPESKADILALSPTGLVPALKWRGETIGDSLAICETIADLFPERKLWQRDALARAVARAASAEMHSGWRFAATCRWR